MPGPEVGGRGPFPPGGRSASDWQERGPPSSDISLSPRCRRKTCRLPRSSSPPLRILTSGWDVRAARKTEVGQGESINLWPAQRHFFWFIIFFFFSVQLLHQIPPRQISAPRFVFTFSAWSLPRCGHENMTSANFSAGNNIAQVSGVESQGACRACR